MLKEVATETINSITINNQGWNHKDPQKIGRLGDRV